MTLIRYLSVRQTLIFYNHRVIGNNTTGLVYLIF